MGKLDLMKTELFILKIIIIIIIILFYFFRVMPLL